MRASTVLVATVLAGVLLFAGAVLERRYALLPGDAATGAAASAPRSSVAIGAEATADVHAAPAAIAGSTSQKLEPARLAALLAVLEPARRAEILGSASRFKQFVAQEVANSATLAAAREHGAGQAPGLPLLMERASQRVLVDSYLGEVVRTNLDPAFPSDAQLQEAYDKNPAGFEVPARVHLWQIFVPTPKGAEAGAVKAAHARAARLVTAARAPKADFARLARDESGHEASRLNDGYMGLLKIDELLPPIAAEVKTLKAGEVSEPIESDGGLHIVKRGAIVPARTLPLAQVRDTLRTRMVQEAAARVRQAAVDKMTQTYGEPVPDDTRLEQWRTELTQPDATAKGPR